MMAEDRERGSLDQAGAPADVPEADLSVSPEGLDALRGEIRALKASQRQGLEALRRELKDGAYWGTVVAVATVLLLMVQNGLLWRQVTQQQAELEMTHRVQLLGLIFDPSDCDPNEEAEALRRAVEAEEQRLGELEPGSEPALRAQYELRVLGSRDPRVCPPNAPLRLREEALLTLAAIDEGRLALRRSNLRRMSLLRAPLQRANLSGADVSGANLSEANLQRVYLRRAKAVGTYFKGADLQHATLTDAQLTGAYFTDANLSGATLLRADLKEANLIRTDFTRTDLEQADLTGADLGAANLVKALNLTQEQLDSAFGTPKTKIPAHLQRPGHWRQPDD